MKWSWKIARIAGIDIYLHATFLLLIYIVGISYWSQQGTLGAVISGVAFILALFACVVLHELGHSLTARRYGIQTRNITLLPIGGVAALERMPDNPLQEIRVALAGPAVNFVIALILYLYLSVRGSPIATEGLIAGDSSFVYRLMLLNVLLGGFNLLPAFPMDGGRVLRASLALRMDHALATQKAARVGQLLAVGLGLLGLLYNPFLALIAVFIWFGAAMENSAEQMKSLLAGATVREAMLHEFHTLSPEDTLEKAVALTLAGSQKDFPVGYPNQLTSILHHSDLIQGLKTEGDSARVGALNLVPITTADINEPLERLLERMQTNPAQVLCVKDKGQVVGLLNLENILELIRIHDAIAKHSNVHHRLL